MVAPWQIITFRKSQHCTWCSGYVEDSESTLLALMYNVLLVWIGLCCETASFVSMYSVCHQLNNASQLTCHDLLRSDRCLTHGCINMLTLDCKNQSHKFIWQQTYLGKMRQGEFLASKYTNTCGTQYMHFEVCTRSARDQREQDLGRYRHSKQLTCQLIVVLSRWVSSGCTVENAGFPQSTVIL